MSEQGKIQAALAYLMDQLVYSDSYGVHGSDFAACRLCNGGGAPGVPLVHEKSCPIACYGDVAQEWWDEREEERKEAAAEIASLRAQLASAREALLSIRSNANCHTPELMKATMPLIFDIATRASRALTDEQQKVER